MQLVMITNMSKVIFYIHIPLQSAHANNIVYVCMCVCIYDYSMYVFICMSVCIYMYVYVYMYLIMNECTGLGILITKLLFSNYVPGIRN